MRIFSKTKKIILLIALTFLLVCSAIVLPTFRAKASSVELDVADFVTKESSSQDMEEMAVGTKRGKTGLYTEIATGEPAEKKWAFDINGTFHGDSKVDFVNHALQHGGYSFAIYNTSGQRLLSYSIGTRSTAATGGNQIAYVKVESQNWNVFTLDESGAQKRLQLTPPEYSVNAEDRTALQDSAIFLPNNVNYADRNDTAVAVDAGYFGLKFTSGQLAVIASTSLGEKEVATLSFADYPELSALTGGYTMKIMSMHDGTDRYRIFGDSYSIPVPMLLAINGVALDAATKSFEENERQISYEGEVFDGTNNVICLHKGTNLEEFGVATYTNLTSTGLGKFSYFLRDEKFAYTQTNFALKAYGDYPITVSYSGFTKDYLVKIDYFATDLFTASPTVQAGTQQGSVSFAPMADLGVGTGMKVNKEVADDTRGGQKWWFDINGTFTGDGSIEYVFTENKDMQEAVSFICSDLEGNRVFTFFVLPVSHEDTANNYLGGLFLESEYKKGNDYSAYVFHGDTEVNASTVTLTKGDTRNDATEGTRALMKALGNGVLPKFGEVGKLTLDFTDTALVIKANTAFGEQTLLTLAYGTYPEVEAIAQNGYKIRIANGEDRNWCFSYNWASQPPSILSINGAALDEVTAPVSYIDAEIRHEKESVDGTYNVINIDETDELGEFFYVSKSTIGGTLYLNDNSKSFAYSESFASKVPDTYDIIVEQQGTTKNYRVIVNKNVPQMYLKDNVFFRLVTNDGTLSVDASDVLVEDKKDGVIASTNVQVAIKAPDADNFVPYDSFTFDPTLLGRYEIRYTAVNSAGVENTLVRVVERVASVPMIVLNGELPEKAYVGQSLTLPTSVNGGDTFTCSVVHDGQVIENVAPLYFENEGVYSVVYTLVDSNDVMAVATYYITVEVDDVAPVITVEEVTERYIRGDTLTAPKATATDGVDGEVAVSVACFYNGKEIGGGSVTATETGIYTFVYTATDKLGNVAKQHVEVFVYSADNSDASFNDDGDKGGFPWLIVGLCVGGAVLVAGVVVTIILIKKKKER